MFLFYNSVGSAFLLPGTESLAITISLYNWHLLCDYWSWKSSNKHRPDLNTVTQRESAFGDKTDWIVFTFWRIILWHTHTKINSFLGPHKILCICRLPSQARWTWCWSCCLNVGFSVHSWEALLLLCQSQWVSAGPDIGCSILGSSFWGGLSISPILTLNYHRC
jgi:hypothetical protein